MGLALLSVEYYMYMRKLPIQPIAPPLDTTTLSVGRYSVLAYQKL